MYINSFSINKNLLAIANFPSAVIPINREISQPLRRLLLQQDAKMLLSNDDTY